MGRLRGAIQGNAGLPRLAPIMAAVVLVAILSTLIWVIRESTLDWHRQTLTQETVEVEDSVRRRLANARGDLEMLAAWIGREGYSEAGFATQFDRLRQAHPELTLPWFRAGIPPGDQAVFGIPVPTEGAGYELSIRIPVKGERAQGELVTSVMLDRLTAEVSAALPKEFELQVASETQVLAARKSNAILDPELSLSVKLRPPLDGLQLRVTANRLTPPWPVVLIAAIGTALALALGGTTLMLVRMVQRQQATAGELRRSEADTAATHARLLMALNTLPQGFVLWDQADRLVLANDRMADLCGVIKDMLVPGSEFRDILRVAVERNFYWGTLDLQAAAVERALAAHTKAQSRREIRTADNRWLEVEERRNDQGETVALYNDITASKRLELALSVLVDPQARSRGFARAAVRAAGLATGCDYAYIGWISADGRWLEVEEAWRARGEDGTFQGPSRHLLSGTPGQAVADSGLYQVAHDRVWLRHPAASTVAPVPVASFEGIPIKAGDGRVLGVLGTVAGRALPAGGANPALLGLVADWARAEYERSRAIRQTLASETRLLDAIESISDGFALWDSARRLVLCNSRYRALFAEVSHLLAEGAELTLFSEAVAADLVAPSVEGGPEEWLLRRLKAHRTSLGPLDIPCIDGRWLRSDVHRSGEGMAVEVVADLTAERRREQALHRASTVVDQSANTVVITDPDGRIEYVNAAFCRITGYEPEDVVGENPRILRSGHTPSDSYAQLWQAILAGQEWRGEFENKRKDGSLYWVSTTISPIRDAQGRITNFVGIGEDVTERRLSEQKLRQAQKMEAVGQLTGGVAHDFNNLLTVVLGNLEILEGRVGEVDLLARPVAAATRAARRGADLTQRLLAFSRKQPLEVRAVDVGELVGGMAEMLRRTLGEGIRIAISLSECWPALTDGHQLENAILNLALNARDAMNGTGVLTLSTERCTLSDEPGLDVRPGDYVVLAVSDTGCGIPAEDIDRVFEPFFTTKDVGKGSGLGLSMVYGFTRQTGGHVRIYSEVGKGTTIKLFLPRAVAEGEVPAQPEAPAGDFTGDESVLVVEDDAEVRAYVTDVLAELGYRVTQAADGAEALGVLAGDAPLDLVFSDVVLPGDINGKQIVDEAKRLRPGIRVLLTSGYAEAALNANGVVPPSIPLLSKPYARDELARKLRQVLRVKEEQA